MEITKYDMLWIKLRSTSIRYSPKIIFYGTIIYILALVLNVIFASLFGYTVITNYISDLGIKAINPFALFHDIICILAGLLCVLAFRYIYLVLRVQYRPSYCAKFINKIALLFGWMGSIGYVFLGIFSLDRAGPEKLYHGISASFAFGGFIFAILFFSLNLILTHRCKLRTLGYYGLIVPLGLVIVLACCLFPLVEWVLFYAIFLFLICINYYIAYRAKLELFIF